MRVGFLGFGLIGGSIARALREGRGDWSMTAWSPTGSGPRTALREGVIDRVGESPTAAIEGAELIVLAAPPLACLDLLDALAGHLRSAIAPGAVVTDVASTKAAICARARQNGIRFVGGHPMAGRETSGFQASDGELLRDRPWIVVPDGSTAEDVARVEELVEACGAHPLRMGAQEHDAATATISHLPLLASVALVEAAADESGSLTPADWTTAARLAASGWRDTTRLARGDPAMATGIVATNAGELAPRLRALRDRLDEWIAELDRDGSPDPVRLEARFAAARDVLESMPG